MTTDLNKKIAVIAGLWVFLLLGGVARAWTVDMEIEVVKHTVAYNIWVCNDLGDDSNVYVDLYYNSSSAPPTSGGVGNKYWVTSITAGNCRQFSHIRHFVPNGKYQAWVQVNSRPGNNQVYIHGPEEYRVGPDLFIYWAGYKKDGASLKYTALVCNIGTDVAKNFRVGFYFNLPPSEYPNGPPDGVYSDKFKSLEELDYDHWWWSRWMRIPWPVCEEIEHDRHNTPNGIYRSWVKADSGDFVAEANENNNVWGPMLINMANPDLEVVKFEALARENPPYTVTYTIRVRNKGADTAKVFWIDLYYDRKPVDAPQLGEPGDIQIEVNNLGVGHEIEFNNITWIPPMLEEDKQCTNYTYDCTKEECAPNDKCLCDPEGEPCLTPYWSYYSWVQLDSDEFVSDPDRSDNLDGPLELVFPPGYDDLPEGCEDKDSDGFGVGRDCESAQDCDDTDPEIYPGAPELCNGKDNDCDDIIDDCCSDVYCCDADNDGYGVGIGCPGPQDPDDNDPDIPGEYWPNWWDGPCRDEDGDGYCAGGGGEDCGVTDPTLCPNGGGDCDDYDSTVNPGGDETCDGVDNNCSGTTDDSVAGDTPCPQPNCVMACADMSCITDSCPNAEPACLYECGSQNTACVEECDIVDCIDHDGDGFGSGEDCAWEDCDDTNSDVYPGALKECDGLDNDCTGTIDDGTPGNLCPQPECVRDCASELPCEAPCGGDEQCLYECGSTNTACVEGCAYVDCVDNDGDGWGVGEDCVIEDPDDNNPGVHPGAGEICGDGFDQNGSGIPDEGCLLCIDLNGDGFGVGPNCFDPYGRKAAPSSAQTSGCRVTEGGGSGGHTTTLIFVLLALLGLALTRQRD